MPQHHRGDRRVLLTRVPLRLADRAHRHAATTGLSVSDLLASALEDYLDEAEAAPPRVTRSRRPASS